MPAPTLLAVVETITSFAIGLFFVWMGWRFWSFFLRRARIERSRLSLQEALFIGWAAAWALGFFLLGALSIVYPFDLHGRMHPPSGSLGAALEVTAFACLPTGVLMAAVPIAVMAHRSRRTGL